MWSLGVILYILYDNDTFLEGILLNNLCRLSGAQPFDAERTVSLFEQIENAMYDFPTDLWLGISKSGTLVALREPSPSIADTDVSHGLDKQIAGN